VDKREAAVCALEVVVTHWSTAEKIEGTLQLGLHIVEIMADDILRQSPEKNIMHLQSPGCRLKMADCDGCCMMEAHLDEQRQLRQLESIIYVALENNFLAAARQKIEEEKAALDGQNTTTLAMSKRPTVSTAKEIKRDGRFIAYDTGTVLDTKTNLMWAAKDNGSNINWANAKSYCENYRGGGYSDWRMPTRDELAGLYDKNKSQKVDCDSSGSYPNHVATDLTDLTCWWMWASETRGSDAVSFQFHDGGRNGIHQSYDKGTRALPVRSTK
jgi:hypothetical protein